MRHKEILSGYEQASQEVQSAIFIATIETRALLKMLGEIRTELRRTNRWRLINGFDRDTADYLIQGMEANLQRITKQVSRVRDAALTFQEMNRGV